jgi:hypothetical protein
MPSYELCRKIYVAHPLGAKIVDKPVRMAQSQKRKISIGKGPEDLLVKRFNETWDRMEATRYARMTMRTARTFGIASLVAKTGKDEPDSQLDLWRVKSDDVAFSIFDPLNTAGSLVAWAMPNDPLFQKPQDVKVQGKTYDRTRSCIVMNEEPVYLEWTSSAFGYVGRSVYQRGLFPLKSFLATMRTDDMVSRKAGLLIAKVKVPGNVVSNIVQWFAGVKRNILKEASTDNVITIAIEEAIESLNLQNIDASSKAAKDSIIKNIAIACETHAKILADEAFVDGFGEGTEDARNIAACIDSVREDMAPIYRFLDPIVMHCAWDEDFYKTVQELHPDEYGSVEYRDAFYEWKNAFAADWPDFLREPESEEIKVREVKFRTAVALVEVLAAWLDPENMAKLVEWLTDCVNQERLLFPAPIELDFEALLTALEEKKAQADEAAQAAQEMNEFEAEAEKPKKPPRPFADALEESVARLADHRTPRGKRGRE